SCRMTTPANSNAQPLSGVRVVDFTQVMMGPCATQMLADYGADVIKIERPGSGDLSRTSIADDPDGLSNPVFRSLNRNKRSTALADYSAGMHMVQGILLALMQREKTGRGQQISVSLYDSMLAMQMQEASMWLQRKRELNWGAFPLTGVFDTTDGAVVIVGAFKANPLQDICRALDLPDLSANPETAQFA